MTRLGSPLAGWTGKSGEADAATAREAAKAAWQQHGIFLANPSWPGLAVEHKRVISDMGEQLYGPRRAGRAE